MRLRWWFSTLLITALMVGCNGGGTAPQVGPLTVGEIQGPVSINEGTSTTLQVAATADTGITYLWTVDPPGSGTFSDPEVATTIFTALAVDANTPVTIQVAVGADNSSTVLKTRQITVIDGTAGNQSPVAGAHASPLTIKGGQVVDFFDDSHDGDGDETIIEWEWDFTFDFTEGFETESEEREPMHLYPAKGVFPVMLRVTDAGGLSDLLNEPLWITVTTPLGPPIAQAYSDQYQTLVGATVAFHDDGSFDPDGETITRYEWDWDNDGVYDEEGMNAVHVWASPGVYYVQFRVTDNEGEMDTLDEPLEIRVNEGWARQAGSMGQDEGSAVAVDDMGVIWVGGSAATPPTLYMGNALLCSYSQAGDALSLVTWGGSWFDVCNGIAFDQMGGLYVTGSFGYTVDFDPGPGVTERTSLGDVDVFLSRFNPDGSLDWVTTWGGLYDDQGKGIAVDSIGYVYVTGYFRDEVDFDPGTGAEVHSAGGQTEVYLVKYDPFGNFVWVRTWGGYWDDQAFSVAVDGFDNTYVCGFFADEVDFDPGAGTEIRTGNGLTDLFLTSLDSGGYFRWVYIRGNMSNELGLSVTVDKSSDVYLTGAYSSEWLDFQPGAGGELHFPKGEYDVFLCKLSTAGVYQWARTWGGTGRDFGRSVAVDSTGNVYVTGNFRYTVDFDPGPGNSSHASHGSNDIFLSKFDSFGDLDWVRTWGGNGDDTCREVTVDSTDNVFITGYFRYTVDFDPGPGVDEHTSAGGLGYQDVFVLKLLRNGYWL